MGRVGVVQWLFTGPGPQCRCLKLVVCSARVLWTSECPLEDHCGVAAGWCAAARPGGLQRRRGAGADTMATQWRHSMALPLCGVWHALCRQLPGAGAPRPRSCSSGRCWASPSPRRLQQSHVKLARPARRVMQRVPCPTAYDQQKPDASLALRRSATSRPTSSCSSGPSSSACCSGPSSARPTRCWRPTRTSRCGSCSASGECKAPTPCQPWRHTSCAALRCWPQCACRCTRCCRDVRVPGRGWQRQCTDLQTGYVRALRCLHTRLALRANAQAHDVTMHAAARACTRAQCDRFRGFTCEATDDTQCGVQYSSSIQAIWCPIPEPSTWPPVVATPRPR